MNSFPTYPMRTIYCCHSKRIEKENHGQIAVLENLNCHTALYIEKHILRLGLKGACVFFI